MNKEQKKEYMKRWRDEHPDKIEEYNRQWRLTHRDELAKLQRERYAKNPSAYLETSHRTHTPESEWATYRLNYFLRKKRIVKSSTCQGCDSRRKLEAHHEDYNKPLDVIWLCRSCHRLLHLNKKRNKENVTCHHHQGPTSL
jgi:hypothetical protein